MYNINCGSFWARHYKSEEISPSELKRITQLLLTMFAFDEHCDRFDHDVLVHRSLGHVVDESLDNAGLNQALVKTQ